MGTKQYKAIFFALLADALYAISSPVSKLLLKDIPPTLIASLLYLGAGLGMSIVGLIKHKKIKKKTEAKLTIEELPYIIGMVVLDIAEPILLMIGLTMTTHDECTH